MSKLLLMEGYQVKELESGNLSNLMIDEPFIDIRFPIDISFNLHDQDDINEIVESFDDKAVEWFKSEFPEYFI